VGLEWGSLSPVSTTEELRGRNGGGCSLESREYGCRDSSRWPRGTLYPQNVGTNLADKGRYSSLEESNGDVCMFSFVDHTCLVICWEISTTEDTSDITRAFFSVVLVCQVVICAFDGSRFEMTIIFDVPISLAVCTLNNIPFVFVRFEYYFATLNICSFCQSM
jgi:hypothetical protein